jgi:multiple sugar transport system permease protein
MIQQAERSAPPAAVRSSSTKNRRPGAITSGSRRFAMLAMLPACAFLLATVVVPIVTLIRNSFTDVESFSTEAPVFVGLANYVEVLQSPTFTAASGRTAAYTAVVVTIEFAVGLLAAMLFNLAGKKSALLRTVFVYPLMIAPIVAGLLWKFLLIDSFGVLNHLLTRLGVLSSPDQIGWLSDPSIVLYSVALPDIWLTTSFMTLILYAGLQSIPGDVIEAARIDGAGPLSVFGRIILPMLRPVIGVALVVRGIDAAKAFDVIQLQTEGGPQGASETLSLVIYREMVRYGEIGSASAMATLYLIAMMVVALIAIRFIWWKETES